LSPFYFAESRSYQDEVAPQKIFALENGMNSSLVQKSNFFANFGKLSCRLIKETDKGSEKREREVEDCKK